MSDKPIDVRGIIWNYLKAHGYDGLYSTDIDCGCELADLMPCDEYGIGNCSPGYKASCYDEDCEIDDCDWHIAPEKPEGE